ncbi:flavodoxin [Campylobacterota bacterium]|nr:flavodoxin [Campylobacterota bacterium]GHV05422.1 flavodoxin [Campylobacterota bacterium]
MARIGIFYASTAGHTAKAAETIAKLLGSSHEVTLVKLADSNLDEMLTYDNLILGSSTWGQGELQSDWREPFLEMDEADFAGKTIALFGTGESKKHGEHFVGALGILRDKLIARGGKIVGAVGGAGYSFKSSTAFIDGKFAGLALDEVNEPHKTKARIEAWVEAIRGSFN